MDAVARQRAQNRQFRTGCEDFDAGRFWEAHEAWETAWHGDQEQDRAVYKGLIQVAAVQHHLTRQRLSAAAAILRRGRIQLLLGSADPLRWPLDLEQLLAVTRAQTASLEAGQVPAVTSLRLLPMLG